MRKPVFRLSDQIRQTSPFQLQRQAIVLKISYTKTSVPILSRQQKTKVMHRLILPLLFTYLHKPGLVTKRLTYKFDYLPDVVIYFNK